MMGHQTLHQGGVKVNKKAGTDGAPTKEQSQEEDGPGVPWPKRESKPNPKYRGPEWALP
jgi:hypothetical protein